MIDLHCHSIYSDGYLTPTELVKKAQNLNVSMMALTDHDNIDGLEEFRNSAIEHNIRPINGIEFSTKWKKYDLHILGLNIDPKSPHILEAIARNCESRDLRAKYIAEKLEKIANVENAYEKAREIAGHGFIGRPHFARVLLHEGKVKEFQGAFTQYLGKGKKAYMPTNWESLEYIVNAIVQGGGQAVIAHPYKYRLTRTKLHELIKAFKEANGKGIEVVSGRMLKSEIIELAGIAQRFGLLASTGSDFHGVEVSEILPGKQALLPENVVPIWHEM